MNALNKISQFFYQPAFGLLLIRIFLGLVFIHHGWMKLSNVPGTMGFMSMIVLGIMTRLAAVLTGSAVLVAIGLVTFPMQGFWGSEFEIVLALASFGMALLYAGKLRLVHTFEHNRVVAASPVM